MHYIHIFIFFSILTPAVSIWAVNDIWHYLQSWLLQGDSYYGNIRNQGDSGPDKDNHVGEEVTVLWGIPDTQANIGRLFHYPIPTHAFSGQYQHIKVASAGDDHLPSWLLFNHTCQVFQGVPAAQDQGSVLITVKVTATDLYNCSKQTHASTDFLIQVYPLEASSSLNSGNAGVIPLRQVDSNVGRRQPTCRWDDNLYVGTLVLDTNMEDLSATHRVSLIFKMANFMQHNIFSLNLEVPKNIFNGPDSRVLMAGPGNVDKLSTNTGAALSWVIACGEFHGTSDVGQVLEHNILTGRLTDELSYLVIGWRVTELLPPEPVRKAREKRQVLINPTVTQTLLPSRSTRVSTSIEVTTILESSTSTLVEETIKTTTSLQSSTESITSTPTPILPSPSDSHSITTSPVVTSTFDITSTIDVSQTSISTVAPSSSIVPTSVMTTIEPSVDYTTPATTSTDATSPSTEATTSTTEDTTPTTKVMTSTTEATTPTTEATTPSTEATTPITEATTPTTEITTPTTEVTTPTTEAPIPTTEGTTPTTEATIPTTEATTTTTDTPTPTAEATTNTTEVTIPTTEVTTPTSEATTSKPVVTTPTTEPTTSTTESTTPTTETPTPTTESTTFTTEATTPTTEAPTPTTEAPTPTTESTTSTTEATAPTTEVSSLTTEAITGETTILIVTSTNPTTTDSPLTSSHVTTIAPGPGTSMVFPNSTLSIVLTTSSPADITTASPATTVPDSTTKGRFTSAFTTSIAGTTPSTTTTTTFRPSPRPVLLNPLEDITTTIGTFFSYTIPSDTFYDPLHGYTNNLTLSMTTLNGQTFSQSSWVQFDSSRGEIYGLPLVIDVTTRPAQFLVIATNAANLQKSDLVEISISMDIMEQASHMFVSHIAIHYNTVLLSRLYLIELVQRLGRVYGDAQPSLISVLSIQSGSVLLSWTNNTVPTSYCDNYTIIELYRQLVLSNGELNTDFKETMSSDFPVISASLTYLGVCTDERRNVTTSPPADNPVSVQLILLPIVAILLVIFLIILLYCFCYRSNRCCCCHDRTRGRYLLDDEESVSYSNLRKRQLAEDTMELSDTASSTPAVKQYPSPSDNNVGPYIFTNPMVAPSEPGDYEEYLPSEPGFDDRLSGLGESPKADGPPRYDVFPLVEGVAPYDHPPPAYHLPPVYDASSKRFDM